MKRILLLAVAALLVYAPVSAQEPAAKPAGKTLTAVGSVTSISDKSLTVKGKDAEWTFTVDKNTYVKAKGATKATAAAKDAKQPLTITQYVKAGDSVTVTYHDAGSFKHAAEVIVRSAAPAAPKK
jgi:hypothetical protein